MYIDLHVSGHLAMLDHYRRTASQCTFPVEPQTRELAFQPADYRIQVHMVN